MANVKYRVVRAGFYGRGNTARRVFPGEIVDGPPGLKYPWLTLADAPKKPEEIKAAKGEVNIEGWREMNPALLVRLAEKLPGFDVPEGVKKSDAARLALEAEEVRRAGTRG